MEIDEEARAVVGRELMLLDPEVRSSPVRLGDLLHPDFVEYGTSGRIRDRAAVMAALAVDPGVPGSATDFSLSRLADDVVLLNYRIVGNGGSLRSSLWLRVPEVGWLVRFHQGTRMPED